MGDWAGHSVVDERETGTHEAEFVGDGRVPAQVDSEPSCLFALSQEDVAFAQQDVPELVELGKRFQPQFGRRVTAACEDAGAGTTG